VTVVIGPEGDFSPDEVNCMTARGAVSVSLGGLILRAETAASVAVALVCDALR
jgi:16S rRNA (uracil1498-N3)-methyltransferase